MVSLQAQARIDAGSNLELPELSPEPAKFSQHKWWDFQTGWKSTLNNLRLFIQPLIFWNLIQPWDAVFANPYLHLGFRNLIEIMNQWTGYLPVNSS